MLHDTQTVHMPCYVCPYAMWKMAAEFSRSLPEWMDGPFTDLVGMVPAVVVVELPPVLTALAFSS